MKKIILTLILSIVIIPNSSLAHPGRTDSSGCHTCKTNCPSWGLSTGEYHCHNAKALPQPVEPIKSTYGEQGTGYTTPAPEYKIPTTTPAVPAQKVIPKPIEEKPVFVPPQEKNETPKKIEVKTPKIAPVKIQKTIPKPVEQKPVSSTPQDKPVILENTKIETPIITSTQTPEPVKKKSFWFRMFSFW